MHDEVSAIAGSCLDLKNRIKQIESNSKNFEKIENLENEIEILKSKLKELANQRNFIDQHFNVPKPAMNEETVEKLQVWLITYES